jgi:hypothetical protein
LKAVFRRSCLDGRKGGVAAHSDKNGGLVSAF